MVEHHYEQRQHAQIYCKADLWGEGWYNYDLWGGGWYSYDLWGGGLYSYINNLVLL